MIRTTLLALMALPFIYSCADTASAADPANIQWVKYHYECEKDYDIMDGPDAFKVVATGVPVNAVALTGVVVREALDSDGNLFGARSQLGRNDHVPSLTYSGELRLINCLAGESGTIVLGY